MSLYEIGTRVVCMMSDGPFSGLRGTVVKHWHGGPEGSRAFVAGCNIVIWDYDVENWPPEYEESWVADHVCLRPLDPHETLEEVENPPYWSPGREHYTGPVKTWRDYAWWTVLDRIVEAIDETEMSE